jgi:hypothetical protein
MAEKCKIISYNRLALIARKAAYSGMSSYIYTVAGKGHGHIFF